MNKPAIGYVNPSNSYGLSIPTTIQNLVIRDYCKRNHLSFRLSWHEVIDTATYPQLHSIVSQASEYSAVIAVSLFMLPEVKLRHRLLLELLERECHFVAVLENIEIKNTERLKDIDDLFLLKKFEIEWSHAAIADMELNGL